MDWLLRLQAAPDDQALRAGVEAWRQAAPEHARAWKRAQEAWKLVGEVPPTHAAEWPAARPAHPSRQAPPPSGRRAVVRRWAAGSLALAASVLLFFLLPALIGLRGDHATATAELRNVALEDGSRVSLGPRSALDVRFSPASRAVSLLEGEAFFEVTADSRRPFVVTAAGVEVTVVGTAFDVRISRGTVAVAVQKGIVAVRGNAGGADMRLVEGDRVKIDRASQASDRDKVPPGEVASWRDRRLFVEGATVAEVVDELGRYRSGWIVVGDSRLAAQRVTGLFELDDTDRALAALVQPFGGRVRSVTPLLQILTSP